MPIENPWLLRLEDEHRHGQDFTRYHVSAGWILCRACGQALRRVNQMEPDVAATPESSR